MELVETTGFTRRISGLMGDDEYQVLQRHLARCPESGVVIPGSGCIRKLRWSGSGRGKRGGVRIIYYHAVSRSVILMLDVFAKNERSDLTQGQLRILARVVAEEYGK